MIATDNTYRHGFLVAAMAIMLLLTLYGLGADSQAEAEQKKAARKNKGKVAVEESASDVAQVWVIAWHIMIGSTKISCTILQYSAAECTRVTHALL